MARMNRQIAVASRAAYAVPMSALIHGRLWRMVIALGFLLATAMPALAAHRSPVAMPACSDQPAGSHDMSDCSDHASKAVSCGLAACTGLAIEIAERSTSVEQVTLLIAFPPARPTLMAGATLPPDPFPPRTRRLA